MIEIHATYDMVSDQVSIFIVDKKGDRRWIAEPIVFKEVEEGLRYSPTIYMEKDGLKTLANELDGMDITPTSQFAQKGELVATKYHLEDMRKLAKVK